MNDNSSTWRLTKHAVPPAGSHYYLTYRQTDQETAQLSAAFNHISDKRGYHPTQRTQPTQRKEREERNERTSLLDRPITAASDEPMLLARCQAVADTQ